MTRRLHLFVAIASVIVQLAPARSWADGPTDAGRSREAAARFERGVGLYRERDWSAALVEFERAYAVYPHYRVQYNIGLCRYELHDYVGALTAFERYLADGNASSIPKGRREDVESLILELRGRVAYVSVSIDVAGAEVDVDDTLVGVAPIASPIAVSVGRHKIGARRDGRLIAVRYVEAAGEDIIVVKFEAPPSPPPAALVASPGLGWSLAPAVASFGMAVLGFGVGTGFGIAAIGDKKTLDRACGPDAACPSSDQSLIDRSHCDATFANAGLSVGLIGVGAGLACLLIGRAGAAPTAENTVGIGPFVGAGSVGATGRC